jgi:hypothetical protein
MPAANSKTGFRPASIKESGGLNPRRRHLLFLLGGRSAKRIDLQATVFRQTRAGGNE